MLDPPWRAGGGWWTEPTPPPVRPTALPCAVRLRPRLLPGPRRPSVVAEERLGAPLLDLRSGAPPVVAGVAGEVPCNPSGAALLLVVANSLREVLEVQEEPVAP